MHILLQSWKGICAFCCSDHRGEIWPLKSVQYSRIDDFCFVFLRLFCLFLLSLENKNISLWIPSTVIDRWNSEISEYYYYLKKYKIQGTWFRDTWHDVFFYYGHFERHPVGIIVPGRSRITFQMTASMSIVIPV